MISRRPDLFAAALTICGGVDVKQADRLKNIAIYDVHGTDDKVVPASRSRDIVNELRNIGNTRIIYKELLDYGHNVWDWTFADDDALDWLFLQTKMI